MKNKHTQKYTYTQKLVLERIAAGEKIKAYTPAHGRQCFDSDGDGLGGVLYLSLTMRALRDKGAVSCRDGCVCEITQAGLNAIAIKKGM